MLIKYIRRLSFDANDDIIVLTLLSRLIKAYISFLLSLQKQSGQQIYSTFSKTILSFLLVPIIYIEITKIETSFLKVQDNRSNNSLFCCNCSTLLCSNHILLYLSNFGFYYYFFCIIFIQLGYIDYSSWNKAFLLILLLIILMPVFFLFLSNFCKKL